MTFQEEIQAAIKAHAMWKIRLLKSIDVRSSDMAPENVCKDNLCEFGKWIYGDTIPNKAKEMREYEVCVYLHKEFHKMTSETLKLAITGQREEALRALSEPSVYYYLSATLIQYLKLWQALFEKANSGLVVPTNT